MPGTIVPFPQVPYQEGADSCPALWQQPDFTTSNHQSYAGQPREFESPIAQTDFMASVRVTRPRLRVERSVQLEEISVIIGRFGTRFFLKRNPGNQRLPGLCLSRRCGHPQLVTYRTFSLRLGETSFEQRFQAKITPASRTENMAKECSLQFGPGARNPFGLSVTYFAPISSLFGTPSRVGPPSGGPEVGFSGTIGSLDEPQPTQHIANRLNTATLTHLIKINPC